MDHFLPSHQNFTQNFARNSKIVILKILVQKWQKICSFQGPKINFGIQWHYRIFWYVSRILKSQPIYRRQKVEVDSTPSAPCTKDSTVKMHFLDSKDCQFFILCTRLWIIYNKYFLIGTDALIFTRITEYSYTLKLGFGMNG